MKMKLTWLALGMALSLASASGVSAAAVVVDTHVSGAYKYTCIMREELKYCGNWNVVSGG